MRLVDYFQPREDIDREDITHIDPFPVVPSMPKQKRSYYLLSRSTLIGAVLGIAALVCLRGCS